MFLIRPHPLLGESLSSWRQRASNANGYRVFPRFTGHYKLVEPDRLPLPDEQEWLTGQYGVDRRQLWFASLDSYADGLFGPCAGTISMPWLLRLGRHKPGCSFCPLCLAEDDQPYFRLSWRLAFVTHCPVHDALMQQGCPECGKPVWPGSRKFLLQDGPSWPAIHVCPMCGCDFATGEVTYTGDAVVVRNLLDVVQRQASPVGVACDSPTYFAGLRALCHMLVRKGNHALSRHIPLSLPDTRSGQFIEYFPPSDRAMLIAGAVWLATEWPHRFVDACLRARFTKGAFHGFANQLPEWIRVVVEQNLSRATRCVTESEIAAAINQLTQQGCKPTKQAILRTLGVTVSSVLNRTQSKRRQATRAECVALIELMLESVQEASVYRFEKFGMMRDCLILVVSALSGENVDDVCAMSLGEVRRVWAEANWERTDLVSVSSRLAALRRAYTKATAAWCTTPHSLFFTSRHGEPIRAFQVKSKVSALMRETPTQELWNSAGVFKGALALNPHDPELTQPR